MAELLTKEQLTEIEMRQSARVAIAGTMHEIFQIATGDAGALLAHCRQLEAERDSWKAGQQDMSVFAESVITEKNILLAQLREVEAERDRLKKETCELTSTQNEYGDRRR